MTDEPLGLSFREWIGAVIRRAVQDICPDDLVEFLWTESRWYGYTNDNRHLHVVATPSNGDL